MATEVAALEAVLDAKIGGFMRAMDEAEKRMQGVETKAKSLTDSVQSVGMKLAAVGAAISAVFAVGMREAEKETQAMNRMRAMVQSVGGDWESMKGQIMPTLQTMEELTGVPVESLVQQFGHLYQKTSDVGKSMKVLEIASGLASQGIGDVTSNSEAMINAIQSGNPAQLLRMDRSLAGIGKKWADQAKDIGAARAQAGMMEEIFAVLAKRASEVSERSPWQRFTYQMGELHKEIGEVVNKALAPLYERLIGVVRIVREFAGTTIGKWVIGLTAAFTVLVTLGGGLIVLVGQVASAAKAIGGFGSILGRLGGVFGTIGTSLLWVVGLLMAFELGLRIGNVLMQWDAFRNLLTRVNGLIGFLIEKTKSFFGHENASLMQTYWDMATGKLVSEKPTEGVSLLGKIGEKLDALKAKLKGTAPELDMAAFSLGDFGRAAGGAAGEVQKLDTAFDDAVGTFTKWQDAVTRSRLQRGQKMGVLSDLLNEQASLEKIVNPTPEQIDALTNVRTQIKDLSLEIEADLRSPWDKAKDSVIEYGGFASEVMSNVKGFASGLADVITNGIGHGFANARKSLGEFFAQFMRQIAAMILQAVILAAILSFLPGGGGFIGNLKGFFGMKAPAAGIASAGGPGNIVGVEQSLSGASLADSFLAGIQSRGSAIGNIASAGGAGGASLARPSFNVVVHEATRRTWVEITDREIEPRLREREILRTVRT